MSSPVVFQYPVTTALFPAAPAAGVVDLPPELAALPVGTVLPAVVFPPDGSGLSTVAVVLPDGAEISFAIKPARPVTVDTPVTIKIQPPETKGGPNFKIIFSAPLPDVGLAARTLNTAAGTAAPAVVPPDPSAAVSVTVTAFPVLNIPESVAALANEIADAALPPIAKPDAKITVEISAKPAPPPPLNPSRPPIADAALPEKSATPVDPKASVFTKETTATPQTPVPARTDQAAFSTAQPAPTTATAFQPTAATPLENSAAPAETANFDARPPVSTVSAYPSAGLSEAPAFAAAPPDLPAKSVETPPEQPHFVSRPDNPAAPFRSAETTAVRSAPSTFQTTPDTAARERASVFKGVVFNPDNAVRPPLIVTSAGVLQPEEPVFFPHMTPVSVKIVPPAPDVPDGFAPSADLKDPTAMRVLASALDRLRAVDEQAFETVKSVLPRVGGKLPALMLAYANAAARNVPFAVFLGETNIAALNKSEHGKSVLTALEKAFSAAPRKAAGGQSSWTAWDIPILSGTVVEPVSLYLQRPNEGEFRRAQTDRKQAGVRFVLDLNLTALGAIQLDGLARRKDRRFDLIVRHRDELPSVFDETVRGIFARTLSALNYTGAVKVDKTDDFIDFRDESGSIAKRGVLV